MNLFLAINTNIPFSAIAIKRKFCKANTMLHSQQLQSRANIRSEAIAHTIKWTSVHIQLNGQTNDRRICVFKQSNRIIYIATRDGELICSDHLLLVLVDNWRCMIHFFPPQKCTLSQQSIFYPLFLNEDGRISGKRLSKLHYRFRRYSTLPKTVSLESQYLQSYDDLLQILA